MVGLCQSGCLLDGYKFVIVCVCVCVFSQGLAETHENNDADKTHCLGLCYGKSVCACVCVCVFHRTGIPLKTHTFLNSQHMWWIFIAATLTSPWQPAGGRGLENHCFLSGKPQHGASDANTRLLSDASSSLLWGVLIWQRGWIFLCLASWFCAWSNFPTHPSQTWWVTFWPSSGRFQFHFRINLQVLYIFSFKKYFVFIYAFIFYTKDILSSANLFYFILLLFESQLGYYLLILTYTYIYLCVSISKYKCIHVYMYTYIHVYIQTYKSLFG